MSTAPQPNPQQAQVIEERALTVAQEAQGLVQIRDQVTFDRAARKLRDVITIRREIEDYHKPLRSAAYQAYQLTLGAIKAGEDKMLERLGPAEVILKKAIDEFEKRMMEEQREKVRKAMEEAERLAAEERKEKLAEAERDAQRQIDQLLAEATTFEEADQIIKQSQGAVIGAVEEAKREPMPVAVYEAPPAIYKHPGVFRGAGKWRVIVENLRELCRAVGEGEASQSLVEPNQKALDLMAKATKEGFNVPGCKAVMEEGKITGRRR